MKNASYLKTVLVLALGGTLFAGYLSGVRLFTKTCAFSEPCPYFLGVSACWYGLGMFSFMLIASALAVMKKIRASAAKKIILAVSFAGILFAGYFTFVEVASWLRAVTRYALVLPTCAYGLFFYLLLFFLSVSHRGSAEGE